MENLPLVLDIDTYLMAHSNRSDSRPECALFPYVEIQMVFIFNISSSQHTHSYTLISIIRAYISAQSSA